MHRVARRGGTDFRLNRRLPVKSNAVGYKRAFDSAFADKIALNSCAKQVSFDVYRTKCVSGYAKCALARRLPLKTRFRAFKGWGVGDKPGGDLGGDLEI